MHIPRSRHRYLHIDRTEGNERARTLDPLCTADRSRWLSSRNPSTLDDVTGSAWDARSHFLAVSDARLVTTVGRLQKQGWSEAAIRAQLDAGRWQRLGYAIVRHNGPLSRRQIWTVGRLHGGPQALLTGFTAAEACGLIRWERDVVHLLVPAGTRLRSRSPVPVRLHHAREFDRAMAGAAAAVHRLPEALLRAAATFPHPRPACGLLAAAVQQRLLVPRDLAWALQQAPRQKHRSALRSAIDDIRQGSEALSEIDFVRLCRTHGLPAPHQQTVRCDVAGRRRYLDATWRRADGRLVVVEVDGALHLVATRWWDDQLRQNELTLADAIVLRFPSVIVRTEPTVVATQLRRALLL